MADAKGKLSKDIEQRIENLERDWDTAIANGIVDFAKFYELYEQYLPNMYEGLCRDIMSDATYQSYFEKYSEKISGKSDYTEAVKDIAKKYPEIKNIWDFAKKNLEEVEKYKDVNKIRSYLHLMYIEDQAECAQFTRLIFGAVGAYDSYLATQIKNLDTASFMSHYLDYLIMRRMVF
ncbi:MAG: hypothetical protein IJ234_09995 [Clostridia bacterium]|nr:hypothetical protein [Clostridia bacterium]